MISCESGTCRLSGEVTVDTVGGLLRDIKTEIAGGTGTLDFAGVQVADSAALALVFSAMREARQAGRELHCTGLPPSFGVLAELYGVSSLLPA